MNPDNIQDGQYDSKVGKYDCIETVSTKLGADGVEETHIAHEIKRKNRWTFTSAGERGFMTGFDKIDWSK